MFRVARLCSLLYSLCDIRFQNFEVWLTVHLSIFISVINQLDAQNFCFYFMPVRVSSTCARNMYRHEINVL